jgi:SulP family sulfate permease
MRDLDANNRWSELTADFGPRRLPLTVGAGLVLAMVNTLLTVALVSLIFGGELRDALPIGIGVGLVGSAGVGLVVAVRSSLPGMYAGIQDASTAILALSAASIAGALMAPEALDTVLAMIAVTSLATGLAFLAMGYFRLGEIARFVPFPVIGGLLAGTGYLIVAGSAAVLGFNGISDLTSIESLGLAWPGIALAALLLTAAHRKWPSWVYLALLVCGGVGFHLVTQISGIERAKSLGRGWLLGPIPSEGLWPGPATDAITGADWSAIAAESVSLASILLIVPISVLLYISAVEVETKRDLDIRAELQATGWANVASALLGGAPGYMYVADTVMTNRMVGPRRGAAVVAALGTLGVATIGGRVLEFLPQFVVGGILLFFGVEFLVEWLWTSRRRMGRLDYALMCGIVVIIATVGFLEGVMAGLVAAIALFVVRYSRIDVVKHALTARDHQSNIERPIPDADLLRERGASVLILELQGYIFFGTAGKIISRIKDHLEVNGSLRFVVCDFRLVTGVDSSAVVLFERIGLLARDHRFTVLLSGLEASLRGQLEELVAEYRDVIREEADLDRAMASAEESILDRARAGPSEPRALPSGLGESLAPYLVARTIPAGEALMTQGDPAPGIFLIRSGQATVLLDSTEGSPVRLRTLLEGTVLGEISLYRREPVTATVVAESDCDVLHLTPSAFDDLCRTDPAAAADFHVFVARILAGRVTHANRAIQAFQR